MYYWIGGTICSPVHMDSFIHSKFIDCIQCDRHGERAMNRRDSHFHELVVGEGSQTNIRQGKKERTWWSV